MLKIVIQQFKAEWKKFIAIILTTIASISFATAFILMGGTTIHQLIKGVKTSEELLTIISATSGSLLGQAAIFISALMVQSIRRRNGSIFNLRLNGLSHKSLTTMFIIEMSIIMIFSFIISLPISYGITKFLEVRFSDINLIDKNWKTEYNPLYYLISFVGLYIILLLVTIIVSMSFKNLHKRKIHKIHKKIYILIGVLTYALMWGGYFAIVLPTRENEASVQLPLFAFVISLIFVGKYIWTWIIKLMMKFTRINSLTNLSFKSLINPNGTILQPTYIIITCVALAAGPLELQGSLEKSTIKAIEKSYSDVQSSLSLNEKYNNFNKVNTDFSLPNENIFISSFTSEPINVIKKFDSEGEMVLRERYAAAVGGNYFLPNIGLQKGDFDDFIGSNRQENSVITSSILKYRIGDQISITFDGESIHKFNVVALYDVTPIKNTMFAEIYLNYEDLQTIDVIDPDDFVIKTAMSNTNYLERFYNNNKPFSIQRFIKIYNDLSFEVFILMSILFGTLVSITIVNTFVLYIQSKKKEFSSLRILGLTQNQIIKMNWVKILTITGITTIASWLNIFIINMINMFVNVDHSIIYYFGHPWLIIVTTAFTFILTSISIMVSLKMANKKG